MAGWLRPREAYIERPREAQRGGAWIEQTCHALGWRLPTSRFTTREAPHRFLYGTREEAPADYHYVGFQTEIHFKPRASPQAELRPGRLPTSRITTREAPHKQNCDQGAYPQAELHTTMKAPHKQNYDQGGRITTREPTYPQAELRPGSWLAGWLAELRPGNLSCAWLAGWLAGGLAGWLRPREAHRGPERTREAQADRG